MTHKNSKDPKYIHNNPIWAQNGPKGAQRGHILIKFYQWCMSV